MKPITINLLSVCRSPLTHQRGVVGNESMVNSEVIRTPNGNASVPVISGNSLRHAMLREPWANAFVGRHDNAYTKSQLSLLYNGGSQRSAGKSISLKQRAEIDRVLTGLSLLGCCLESDIIGGKLNVGRGILVCSENAERIRAMLGDAPELGDLARASTFVGRWQYVRSPESQLPGVEAASDANEDAAAGMPFGGTCVIPGAAFAHQIILRRPTAVRLGCVLDCLDRWQHAGGYVGGMQAKGHGSLATVMQTSDADCDEARDAYQSHVESHVDEEYGLLTSVN